MLPLLTLTLAASCPYVTLYAEGDQAIVQVASEYQDRSSIRLTVDLPRRPGVSWQPDAGVNAVHGISPTELVQFNEGKAAFCPNPLSRGIG